jgi:hypothetical protein
VSVRVVDGARASIFGDPPPRPKAKKEFSGAQRFSTVVKGMEEGGTIRILVDGQEYEIARIG